MTDRKLRVFLCHSSNDKQLVRVIHKKLLSEGWIDSWLDEEKLFPGQDWDREIEKAVENTDVVIVCLSNNSVSKEGYVQKELRRVLDKAEEKPEGALFIIPLRLDNCEPPRRLAAWQYVDYFPVRRRKQSYQRLLESLQKRAERLGTNPELSSASSVNSSQSGWFDNLKVRIGIAGMGLALVAALILFSMRNTPLQPPATDISTKTLAPIVSSSTVTPKPTKTFTPAPTPTLFAGATQVTNDVGVTWVYVPKGKFSMGSKKGFEDETPVHTVTLDAFWIGQTEITNAMYDLCIKSNICRPHVRTDYYSRDGSLPAYPTVFVSWDDAKKYCQWVGGRLPTEAEWEFAARGTDDRVYPWGNEFQCKLGNFDDETALDKEVVSGGPNCDGYQYLAPVGIFPGNISPYGALDMAGNVWEWVSDWYGKYEKEAAVNPVGPKTGDRRVVRGGSWLNHSDALFRTSNRYSYPPDLADDNVGFRCVIPAE